MVARKLLATRVYGVRPTSVAVVALLASVGVLAGGGPPEPTITTIANPAFILIPGRGVAVGTTITVPPGLGSLQELTVTLHGLNHPQAYRIYDLWVANPRGVLRSLMRQVGGDAPASGLTVSFNDAGVEFGSPLISTTYRPMWGRLTLYNGADPAGDWYLTANVAVASGQGSIGNGWSLTVKTSNFPNTFTFSDDPLSAVSSTVKSAHLTELRASVNTLRQRHGLSAFLFADTTPTTIRGVHLSELRTALGGVFSALGRTVPAYTDPTITAGTTAIKAAHFTELRAAIREADAMPLTISKTGTGTGLVRSTPAGIYCGPHCSDAFVPGATVTVTPTASAGSIFAGWQGACTGTVPCEVTMDAAKTATATFNLAPLMLTIAKSGAGSGTVTSNPPGINCGATCVQAFPSGTVVDLNVNPTAGSTFSGWSGGGCSGTGDCQVTITASTEVTAAFTPATPRTYDAQPSFGNLGAWGGCNSRVISQSFQVTAPPGTTWTIDWFGSDEGAPMHAGGLNKTSGTGSDTVIFTIDISSQSPSSGRTCADLTEYYHLDYFTFDFYNSSGALIASRYPIVAWTYLRVQ
jgi:hypothetical protein